MPGAVMIWACVVLLMSVVLGGGTKAGFLSDAVLQLLAVPLLVGSLFSLRWKKLNASARVAVFLVTSTLGIGLVQVVPLPFAAGLSSGSLPFEPPAGLGAALDTISRSPHATVQAILAGLPSVAIFLATLRLSWPERRGLTLLLLGIGSISIVLGLLQVAQGTGSGLRFYTITNVSEAVGFFSNRNHFAALIYVLLLLGAAWAIEAVRRAAAMPTDSRLVPIILAATGLAILLATQMLARSRAGLALTTLALIGTALLVWRSQGSHDKSPVALIAAAAVLAVLLPTQFALYRVLERFGADTLADARLPFARNTLEAAWANFPFGAGLGTFVEVYGLFERPVDALRDVYVNRAHNDFLEVWLEAGVPAAVLLLVFVAWFTRASIAAWRAPLAQQAPIDVALARASSVIVLLLLLHSLVDYPLRTAALLSVFALACGLLVPPQRQSVGADETAMQANVMDARHPGEHLQSRSDAQQFPAPRRRTWGDEIVWPSEWRATDASLSEPATSNEVRTGDDRAPASTDPRDR